ncbi:unnamed protein product, partial [Closterium sp. Naga37s-1]
ATPWRFIQHCQGPSSRACSGNCHVSQPLCDVSRCHMQLSRSGGLTVPERNLISGQVSQTRLLFRAPHYRFQPPHIQLLPYLLPSVNRFGTHSRQHEP